MSDDCTHTIVHHETFCTSKPRAAAETERPRDMELFGKGCRPLTQLSPNFEVIDGLLYRKKLEKGFINYREVLDEDRRDEAISTFHQRRPGQRHFSLEETYKCVAENYWWEGMYFQIRGFVLSCPECQSQSSKKIEKLEGVGCITKTIASHSTDMLNKLRSQRETGLFCDITLRTSGRSYSAHRAVLAAVSDHFQEVFTEMGSSMKADIDLTAFSEDSLLSLLDFSYSSTLCVHQEDLPEVFAMARHLGMWPAVEACTALMKEQEQEFETGKGFTSTCSGACSDCNRGSKRTKTSVLEDNMNDGFSLASDESLEGSPRRNLCRMTKPPSCNGSPLSPSHRMKLMDFKSPSKKYSSEAPSNAHLVLSNPGTGEDVQRFLPVPESPQRKMNSHSVTHHSCASRSRPTGACSPVRVKQEVEEVGEDEEDYARAQEKYKLMNVLGLQRTSLLPRPEDLIGWRQKKRLRKLKANNYSLTKRRKPRSTSPGLPYSDMALSLPLCNTVNTCLLNKSVKTKAVGPARREEITPKRVKAVQKNVPPSDRSMRSKGVLPDMFQPASRASFGGRELRRSVRRGESSQLSAQPPLHRNTNKTIVKSPVKFKSEPVECSISGYSLPANDFHGQTPHKSPPSQGAQARNKLNVEAVRTLRYNSSRPAVKAKLRRSSTREMETTKFKAREEGRRMGSLGLRGVMDTRLRAKENEAGGLQLPEQAPPPSIYSHPLYKVIKEEPAEPVPVGPFPDPPSPDLGKRQSKPPIKLLDSGFLFSFCRPAGGPIAGLKKEEESVDICLTRSVSQVGETFGAVEPPHRTLRARVPSTRPVVKREKEERPVSQKRIQRPRPNSHTQNRAKSARSQATQPIPKQQDKVIALSSRSCAVLDAVRRARLKQLRGPLSQAPKVPKTAHACQQCSTSYTDCDALIMHRLRHIQGKHWPCPLCSKTFFRLRNVRNHIRTHDAKLYKCRNCIVAGS